MSCINSPQGSHQHWKTWKKWETFFQSGDFEILSESQGKVRELSVSRGKLNPESLKNALNPFLNGAENGDFDGACKWSLTYFQLSMDLEYNDVVMEVRGAMQPGRLKLQSDSIIFRNIKTGKNEQFSGSDIKSAQWLIRARGYCLKITLVNGTIHRFDGMRESVSVYRPALQSMDLKYFLRHWKFYINLLWNELEPGLVIFKRSL